MWTFFIPFCVNGSVLNKAKRNDRRQNSHSTAIRSRGACLSASTPGKMTLPTRQHSTRHFLLCHSGHMQSTPTAATITHSDHTDFTHGTVQLFHPNGNMAYDGRTLWRYYQHFPPKANYFPELFYHTSDNKKRTNTVTPPPWCSEDRALFNVYQITSRRILPLVRKQEKRNKGKGPPTFIRPLLLLLRIVYTEFSNVVNAYAKNILKT